MGDCVGDTAGQPVELARQSESWPLTHPALNNAEVWTRLVSFAYAEYLLYVVSYIY